jgi:predicted NAD/FAD-dependent oxidoreductase
VPAITIHAGGAFSREHWEDDRMQVGEQLLTAAERWIGSKVASYQVHGWRYSKPVRLDPSSSLVVFRSPLLIVAGDAFSGPRVEGATLSGWSAARALMEFL